MNQLLFLLFIMISGLICIAIAWDWGRLPLTALAFDVVAYVALVLVSFVDLPTALLCERGRTDIEVSPNTRGAYRFEEYRVGPCVFYNPEGGD